MRPTEVVHLGIDDTDSPEGLCTTYLGSILTRELQREGAQLVDYPNLIRLNPNIPWKTRGNGAVAIRFRVDRPEETVSRCIDIWKEYSAPGSNAAIVALKSEQIPPKVEEFSRRALYDVMSVRETVSLLDKFAFLYRAVNGRIGLIGALAAIGNTLKEDYTYELIAFRSKKMWGKRRKVDKESVRRMDEATKPFTFNNIDPSSGRVMITPHGPDPVLLGIRGETQEAVKSAFALLKVMEPVDHITIFRTNQGTGEHLQHPLDLGHLRSFQSGFVRGTVVSKPRVQRGGHVSFSIRNETGSVDCWVYEPTKDLRWVAAALLPNDLIEVGGGIRRGYKSRPKALNVEYIRTIDLTENFVLTNPFCESCHSRLTSMGRGKGFRCRRCGSRYRNARKIAVPKPRSLRLGLHLPPISAHRHLTRPAHRWDSLEPTVAGLIPPVGLLAKA